MSLVRKALKQHKTDFKAFTNWMEKVSKGQHKRIWDAYESDLKKWNDAYDELGVWIQKHVDDRDFNWGHLRWQKRLKRLHQRVEIRLARIMEAHRKGTTS